MMCNTRTTEMTISTATAIIGDMGTLQTRYSSARTFSCAVVLFSFAFSRVKSIRTVWWIFSLYSVAFTSASFYGYTTSVNGSLYTRWQEELGAMGLAFYYYFLFRWASDIISLIPARFHLLFSVQLSCMRKARGKVILMGFLFVQYIYFNDNLLRFFVLYYSSP